MSSETVTLVVGTTPDYIDWIRRTRAGTAIFLTDPLVRAAAAEQLPEPHEELMCDLADYRGASQALAAHLGRWRLDLDGVACFDCESMELAAVLSQERGLPYPTVETIAACRDKRLSKARWHRDGLSCPAVAEVGSIADAARFLAAGHKKVVLKPATGSGSELVFACASEAECAAGLAQIRAGLDDRAGHRMYRERPVILVEEFVEGEEHSCDFLVDHGRVTLIRLTRKIRDLAGPPGTIRAYVLCDPPPPGIDEHGFLCTLAASARSLGVTHGLCMLDFIVRDGQMVLLELTPRPGGDCLPWLLQHARGLDMLGLALDVAAGRPTEIEDRAEPKTSAALRIHATRNGVIAGIDDAALGADSRVRVVTWLHGPGHVVRMPPADYDSWLLGHALFAPEANRNIEDQCAELLDLIQVKFEDRPR